MKTLLNRLQTTLLPSTGGIFWISAESLHETPVGFGELDYFFDNLLSEYILTNQTSDKSLFTTKSFDLPLFLGHFTSGSPNLKSDLSQVLKISANNLKEQSVILIASKEHQHFFNELISQNSKIKFKKFALD